MFVRALAAWAILLAAGCASVAANDAPSAGREWAAQCEDWDEWDKAGPPFRVFGNTYYVGTCGISAILIAGDAGDDGGHVLIDSGTEKGAEIVAANIRALGFDPRDVEILLMSHEHHDHVGGMARLLELTGGHLLVRRTAAKAMKTGEPAPDDPQFAEGNTLPPVRLGGSVLDGIPVALGSIRLTPVETPGHTPGATSWQWRSCEGETCRTIVYADSLTPVSSDGYRFSDHTAYLDNFRRSLSRLAQLDCDILLAPHPSAANMRARLLGEKPWYDPLACADYAAGLSERLEARVAEEKAGG